MVRFFAFASLLFLLVPNQESNALSESFGRKSRLTVSNNSELCPEAQFAVIQDAINAATAGDTIHICPGVYPEQLSITKPISLVGDDGVVIQPVRVEANSTSLSSGHPIAAIILVQNVADVYIRKMEVDGLVGEINECSPDFIGIFYRNASGGISHVHVQNLKLAPNLDGCQSGSGIFVQSGLGGGSHVEIRDNIIQTYQKNGITANEDGTEVRIEDNIVVGAGSTNGAAQNGIQIGYGASGTVESNWVSKNIWAPCLSIIDCAVNASDILVFQSDNIDVLRNQVAFSQVGIAIIANGADTNGNYVTCISIFDGIQLTGNDNEIENNIIRQIGESSIFIQGNTNVVTNNDLIESPIGILKTTGSTGNTIKNNRFRDTAVNIQDPPSLPIRVAPYR
jgi:nitrous oxidase accessory protein NosD